MAVSRSEASMMGSLGSDEGMIYKQIKDSGNEGIWTKALKARTNLHQTILTRVLKALENRQLIKAVKSVKNPTRKIYMLYNLTPSVELSGGPWYTDNELDVPFINGLSRFCHYYIQQQTWPDGYQTTRQKLYPASYTNRLPTAPRILRELMDKQVTSTSLTVGEMQQLLETLVYDEKIEKVPMPGGVVEPPMHEVAVKSDDEDFDWGDSKRSKDNGGSSRRSSSKTRKKKGRDSGSPASGTDSGSESSSGSSASDDGRKGKKRKRSESRKSSSKSAKRSRKSSSSRSSRNSRDRSTSAASSASEEVSDDDSGLSDDPRSSKKRLSKSKSDGKSSSSSTKGSKSRPTAKYTGPEFLSDDDDDDQEGDGEDVADADNSSWGAQNWVYRALRPVEPPLGFTETPCARCPVSDFCRPRGPVNAEDCVYYNDWMDGAWSDSEEEEDDKYKVRAREKKKQANGTT